MSRLPSLPGEKCLFFQDFPSFSPWKLISSLKVSVLYFHFSKKEKGNPSPELFMEKIVCFPLRERRRITALSEKRIGRR